MEGYGLERRYHLHHLDNYLQNARRHNSSSGLLMPYTIILLIIISLPLIGMKRSRIPLYLMSSIVLVISLTSIPMWDRGIHGYLTGWILLASCTLSSINSGIQGDAVFHPRSLAHLVNLLVILLVFYCVYRILDKGESYLPLLFCIPYLLCLSTLSLLGAEESLS